MNSRVEEVRTDLEAAKASGHIELITALEKQLQRALKFDALLQTLKKSQAERKGSSNG